MNMELHQFFFYGMVIAGSTAVISAVIFLIYTNYNQFENQVMDSISDYAAEIYKNLDLMFMRRSMNFCYLLIVITSGVFASFGFLIGLVISVFWALVAGSAAGFLGYKVPGVFVRAMFKKRIAKFDMQLTDALNMMSNAIKSGLSFMQVIQLLEKELPSPASQEFSMVLRENRIGVNLNDALLNMTKRVPSEDLFMIINSVVTLSQQGGDLSEAFETIAFTIRERQRVHEKIRTLAQAGLTQAAILSALPLVYLGIRYWMEPQLVSIMFTTQLGWIFLGVMVLMITLGAVWMKKILTIEI